MNLIKLIRRRLSDMMLLKSHYRNSVSMMLMYVLGKSNIEATLKSGASFRISGKLEMYGSIRLAELIQNEWKVELTGDRLFIVRSPSGLRFKCRTGPDFGHLVEIFIKCSWSVQAANGIIIDVGMSNGDSELYFIQSGARLVIGLEPHVESFKLAEENILLNGMQDRIIPLNLALSSRSETSVAHLSPEGHYVLPVVEKEPTALELPEIQVSSITLEELVQRNSGWFNANDKIIVKIDCEGCENDVISNLSTETFTRIKELIFEFHSEPSKLIEKLEQNGFIIQKEASNPLIHAKRPFSMGQFS
jgi:FkbM family methyltransferase